MAKEPKPTAAQKRKIIEVFGLGLDERTAADAIGVSAGRLQAWLKGPLGRQVEEARQEMLRQLLLPMLALAKRNRSAEALVRRQMKKPAMKVALAALLAQLSQGIKDEDEAAALETLRRLLGKT